MIVLSAQNVAKSFGVNEVLRDVSFTLQQGDRLGLVGVNGCGKCQRSCCNNQRTDEKEEKFRKTA